MEERYKNNTFIPSQENILFMKKVVEEKWKFIECQGENFHKYYNEKGQKEELRKRYENDKRDFFRNFIESQSWCKLHTCSIKAKLLKILQFSLNDKQKTTVS